MSDNLRSTNSKHWHWLLPLAVVLEIGAVYFAVRTGDYLSSIHSCSKFYSGQLVSWLLAIVGITLAISGAIILIKQHEKHLRIIAMAIVVICVVLSVAAWVLSVVCMAY